MREPRLSMAVSTPWARSTRSVASAKRRYCHTAMPPAPNSRATVNRNAAPQKGVINDGSEWRSAMQFVGGRVAVQLEVQVRGQETCPYRRFLLAVDTGLVRGR